MTLRMLHVEIQKTKKALKTARSTVNPVIAMVDGMVKTEQENPEVEQNAMGDSEQVSFGSCPCIFLHRRCMKFYFSSLIFL